MLVKGGGFIGMIQYVREQARSVGQIALSDAGTVHAWISLTDEQAAAKDSTLLSRISAGGQNLGDVVINGERDNHHDADEADLKHRFLDVQAEIALHHHFHQQHQDHAAIQNRDGQQVEDGEVAG